MAEIFDAPSSPTNDISAHLTIGGTGVDAYRYNLDNTGYKSETPFDDPISLTLGHGVHTISVIGKDEAGNWQSTDSPTTATWEVDTDIPVAEVSGKPASPTRLTSAALTVGGTGVTHYRYNLDGAGYQPETAIDTPISLTGLSHGDHAISVIAKDAAGNWQPTDSPTTVSWTVDTQAPTVAVSNIPTSPTNDPSATLTVGGEDVTHYRYNLDSAGYLPAAPDETPVGDLSLTALTHGDHTVSFIGRDVAGNWQSIKSPTTVSWSVDTKAPTATLSGMPSSPTNDITATLTVGGTGVVAYRYNLDNTEYKSETPFDEPISLTLGHGVHTVSVIGKDKAGNWQSTASPTSVTWEVDTDIPVAEVSGEPASPTRLTFAALTVGGTDVEAYRYNLDDTGYQPETAIEFTISLTGLSHGDHAISVIAKDAAGNWQPTTSPTTVSWTVDTQAPTVAVSNVPASPTNDPSATLTVGGENVTHYRYNLDNAGYLPAAPDEAAVGDLSLTALSHGDHTVSFIGRDAAGNWQSIKSPTTVSWTVDTQAPTAVVSDAPDSNTNATTATMTVGGDGVVAYRYNLDNSVYEAETPATEAISLSGLSSEEHHTLSIIAKDAAGNWQPETDPTIVEWTVDTDPPIADIATADRPSSPTNVSSFSLPVTGEQVTQYKYKLDSDVFSAEQPVETKIKLLNLKDGPHTLQVIGRDAAGNWQSEPGKSIEWEIDTTGPVISDLSNFSTPTKTAVWTWNVDEPAKFRYLITEKSDAMPSGEYNEMAERKALKTAAEGIWYLRLQAKDDLGNESPVVTAYAVLDNTPPVVEGLENDDVVRQSKSWIWWADEPCTYRSALNLTPEMTTFPDIEYSDENTISKENADGKWYLHVQARDRAGNESEIETVYAIFDNATAIITGLNDDPTPKQTITWEWASDEPGVLYRYVIDDNAATIPSAAEWFQPTTADNSYSVTVPGDYPDGVWYLHVQARDASGVVSKTKTVYAVLDTTPPVISGLADDPDPIRVKYWEWSANEKGATFRHAIDRNPDGAPATDLPYDEIAEADMAGDGEFYLHVQAKDIAGNQSAVVTVSTLLDPNAPIVPYVTGDTPTSNPRPTWRWRSGGGNRLFKYTFGAEPEKGPTYDTQFTSADPQVDGIYSLAVEEQDADTLEWSDPTIFEIEVDTSPPTDLIVDGIPAPLINQNSLTLTFSSAEGDAVAYKYNLDGAIVYSEERPLDQDLILTESELGEGPHLLYIIARDEAGNWQKSAEDITEIVWEIDTQSPALAVSPQNTEPTKHVTWTWEAPGEEGTTFRYAVNRNDTWEFTEADPFTAATGAEQSDGNGIFYLHVQARDAAGNDSDVVSVLAVLDNTAPVVKGLTDQDQPARTVAWNWSADDADAEVAFRFKVDQDAAGLPLGDYGGQTAEIKSGDTGRWYLHIQALDRAGNESGVTTVYAELDNSPPLVEGIFDDPTPKQSKSWSWTSEANTRFRFCIDQEPGGMPTGDFTDVAAAGQAQGDGYWYLHVQPRDVLGNVGRVFTVYATLDNTPPAVLNLSDDDAATSFQTWTWDADEPADFRHAIDPSPTWTFPDDEPFTPARTATLSHGDGTWHLHVQARDRAGNIGPIRTVNALMDTTPPELTGLTDDDLPKQEKTWQWGSDDGEARFRFLVDQNPSGIPTGEYSDINQAAAGSGDGIWYLHVQAKDAVGNVSPVKTVFAVLDNTPPGQPYVTGPPLTNDPTPTWNWSQTYGDGIESFRYKVGDSDLESGAALTSARTFTPETPLPTGDHTLYVQQRDSVGNWSQSGQFTIHVDTEAGNPPLITGPASPVNDPLCTFNWTSGGGASIYRYALNGGAWSTPTDKTQAIISVPEGPNLFSVQERDETDNWSGAAEYPITVDTGIPCSSPSGPAVVDDTKMTFTITYTHDDVYSGERCGSAGSGSGLKLVDLFVKGPGDAAFTKAATDMAQSIDGRFTYTVSQSRQGAYAFYTEAEDHAGNREDKSLEETQTVYVSAFSGYAILGVGAIAGEEGLPSHTLTANNIYKHLIQRNFALVNDPIARWEDPMDHIKYLNPYPEPQMGQDIYTGSYKAALQDAVTGWAPEKMAELSGPLFIILVNHGSPETFYLTGTERLLSGELDEWLEILEEKLALAGVDEEIVLILGTCYSGSFIDNLSKPGRIIVTSTAPGEVSYRGPKDPSGVRDGEFFLTALFNELGQDIDLAKSFETAAKAAEIHTDSGTGIGAAPYFDTALQHPLLDDNGDGKGSSDLGIDGDRAAFIRLGHDTGAPKPVTVSAAGAVPATPLSPDASRALIWAEVSDQNRADRVWVEIRKPGLLLEKSTDQQTVELIEQPLTLNPGTGRYEADFSAFVAPGRYTLFFYVRDTMGLISTFHKKYLYKGKEGNLPPDPFGLNRPAEGEEPPTTLLLDWNDATDPEGDTVTYTVWVSAGDEHFGNPLIFEGLNRSLVRLTDADGLNDATKYFWKVLAVDDYGAMTPSEVRSFTTNNENAVAAWFTGNIFNTATGTGISGAEITFQTGSDSSSFNTGAGGYIIDDIPPNTYSVSATAADYNPVTVDSVYVPAGEVSQYDIGLDPIGAKKPVMTPYGWTYDRLITVAITSDTTGAVIRYTLDGSEPNTSSPVYSSPISLTATTTVKARAYASGMPESEVATERYAITIVDTLPKPVFSPEGNTYPSAQSVAISCGVDGATLRYTTDGTAPTSASLIYNAPISVSDTTSLKTRAFKSGWYESETATAHYTLTGTVSPPVFSPDAGPISALQNVTLTCPTPGASIHYTTDGSEPTAASPRYMEPISHTASVTRLKARAFLVGWNPSAAVSAEYAVADMVAQPVFSPGPGIYKGPQLIAITCATPDALIYYTIDGTEPTENSRQYQNPIYVPQSLTLKARGFLPDYPPGITASGTYRIIRKGDLDGDGFVDLRDVVTGLKVLAGMDVAVRLEGDVDGDLKIGMGDVIFILWEVAGM